jgi:hypothetical protein
MVVARKSRKHTNQRMFEPSDEEKLVKPSFWTAAVFDITRTLRVLVVGPSPPEATDCFSESRLRILAIG